MLRKGVGVLIRLCILTSSVLYQPAVARTQWTALSAEVRMMTIAKSWEVEYVINRFLMAQNQACQYRGPSRCLIFLA